MTFDDFCKHPSAQMAKLGAANVLAIRLYSTAAFRSLNNPLRDQSRTQAHPFSATIFFLTDGIRKLRAIEAASARDIKQDIDLWRGMKNLAVTSDFEIQGGSEMAMMSTTDDAAVALEYATSRSALLIKLATSSFMDRGADIS